MTYSLSILIRKGVNFKSVVESVHTLMSYDSEWQIFINSFTEMKINHEICVVTDNFEMLQRIQEELKGKFAMSLNSSEESGN